MRLALLALAAAFALGCTGRVSSPGTDPPGDSDAGGPAPMDATAPRVDAGGPPDPACEAVSCGENARCVDATGRCRCLPGFVDRDGTCVAADPGDPSTRSTELVCDRWRAGHVENASPAWIEGSGECDPGTLAPGAIEDTLRRIELFRWLAGLRPVVHDDSRHRDLMECAYMMHVNRALDHEPPTTWQCWTSGGAAAAGRSNIALGGSSAPDTIDRYMGDRNTESLGHRRWLMSAGLGAVEIGSAGTGHCLGIGGGGGSADRSWGAYPNPGPAPIDLVIGSRGEVLTWSVHAYGLRFDADASVGVVRTGDGASLPVRSYQPGGFGPSPTLAFEPTGWVPELGESYRVTVRGTSMGDIEYVVTLIGC